MNPTIVYKTAIILCSLHSPIDCIPAHRLSPTFDSPTTYSTPTMCWIDASDMLRRFRESYGSHLDDEYEPHVRCKTVTSPAAGGDSARFLVRHQMMLEQE